MIYEVLEDQADRVVVATSAQARRGRGVLFATAPMVVYVLFASALWFVAVGDMTLWTQVKEGWLWGFVVAMLLSASCFLLGRRVRDHLTATSTALHLVRLPALGTARILSIPCANLAGVAVEPSLRSLGADVLLVAVQKDGQRTPLLEGDPHSDQIRWVAGRIAALARLTVEAPKFSSPSAAA